MKDETIIQMLFDRDETALQEISSGYGRLYASVLRGILSNESDVEECANDVLVSAWNTIPPNRPAHLSAYLCSLAKRIGIDRLRYNVSLKRNPKFVVLLSELEECIADESEPFTEEEDGGMIRDALNRFLRGLDRETRVLFIRRYVYSETVSELSERFQIKENTITQKLSRSRKKLKQFLTKEGIKI